VPPESPWSHPEERSNICSISRIVEDMDFQGSLFEAPTIEAPLFEGVERTLLSRGASV